MISLYNKNPFVFLFFFSIETKRLRLFTQETDRQECGFPDASEDGLARRTWPWYTRKRNPRACKSVCNGNTLQKFDSSGNGWDSNSNYLYLAHLDEASSVFCFLLHVGLSAKLSVDTSRVFLAGLGKV